MIDYSKTNVSGLDASGNVFENGSRHPKWKGGVNKAVIKQRAKTYKQYGIGVVTASNSGAAFPKGTAVVENNLENFIVGKIDSFTSSFRTTTKKEKNVLIQQLKRINFDINLRSFDKLLKSSRSELVIRNAKSKSIIYIRFDIKRDSATGEVNTHIELSRIKDS